MKVKRDPEAKESDASSDLEARADQFPLKKENGTDSSSARTDRTPSKDTVVSSSSNSTTKSDLSSSSPIKGTYKGASSYYLFALNDGARKAVLDALVSGGFKVIRIFVSDVYANNKGSDSVAVNDGAFLTSQPRVARRLTSICRSVEPYAVGKFDDTILFKIDQLMLECSQRGQ